MGFAVTLLTGGIKLSDDHHLPSLYSSLIEQGYRHIKENHPSLNGPSNIPMQSGGGINNALNC